MKALQYQNYKFNIVTCSIPDAGIMFSCKDAQHYFCLRADSNW